ncbi:MAG: hypothetical protein K2G70_07750 [Turicibacter sp.]|nr:hypothetical protein [Turicibacter sp.]
MCIERIVFYVKILYGVLSSEFVANIISFLGLLIAAISLLIGGKKVTEALLEYKHKKQAAVFSYHTNMKIFILRLKRLISNNQCRPMKSLYLFSSEENIREKGTGYEMIAEKLSELSQNMLDYLSTESDQIPASVTDGEAEKWDNLIDKLIDFLADFLLYKTDSYLSEFDSEEGIEKYHKELAEVLDNMLILINESKNELRKEISS